MVVVVGWSLGWIGSVAVAGYGGGRDFGCW